MEVEMPDNNQPDNLKESARLSRRKWMKLTAGATAFTFLQRRTDALSLPQSRFFNRTALERLADRDAQLKPSILIDAQTHVWWREGGLPKMTPRGEAFLKALAGARASVVGQPVPVADMGRIMFIDDLFLKSETDIAFLNSFGMRAAFDGVD